jgi:hypothetical protein
MQLSAHTNGAGLLNRPHASDLWLPLVSILMLLQHASPASRSRDGGMGETGGWTHRVVDGLNIRVIVHAVIANRSLTAACLSSFPIVSVKKVFQERGQTGGGVVVADRPTMALVRAGRSAARLCGERAANCLRLVKRWKVMLIRICANQYPVASPVASPRRSRRPRRVQFRQRPHWKE